MALPVFDTPLDAKEAGYDAIPLTFGGIVYVSEAGKEALANGAGSGGSVAWGSVTGKPTTFAPVPATASVVGGVKAAATQAASTATDVAGLVTDFNALLTKLKAAGIML